MIQYSYDWQQLCEITDGMRNNLPYCSLLSIQNQLWSTAHRTSYTKWWNLWISGGIALNFRWSLVWRDKERQPIALLESLSSTSNSYTILINGIIDNHWSCIPESQASLYREFVVPLACLLQWLSYQNRILGWQPVWQKINYFWHFVDALLTTIILLLLP